MLKISILVIMFLTLTTSAWSSVLIEKTKIPTAVLKAAKKDSNGYKLIETYFEQERGIIIYELRYKNNDSWIELNYNQDGILIEVEKKISIVDVPDNILNILKLRVPNAIIDPNNIEKSERYTYTPKGERITQIFYEFDESDDIDRGKNKKCDIEISADGSEFIIAIEPHQK